MPQEYVSNLDTLFWSSDCHSVRILGFSGFFPDVYDSYDILLICFHDLIWHAECSNIQDCTFNVQDCLFYIQDFFSVQGLFNIHSRFIQYLFKICSMFIEVLCNVHSRFIQCSFKIYSVFIQYSFKIYSMFIQDLFKIYLMFIQDLFNVHLFKTRAGNTSTP